MPRGKDKKNYTMYNQTLYEVERVVQIKWIKNRQYCYIKWKGYDERYNTWEPKEHITFCYNYVAPEEKEDDPEYPSPAPAATTTKTNHNHHYHTRGKHRPKDYRQALDSEEKEDHTNLEDNPQELHQNSAPISNPDDLNELQVRNKNADQTCSMRMPKECLITKIIELKYEQGRAKRLGKVRMEDGSIAYMDEDILKTRYPEKVIEYYEFLQLRFQKQNAL